MTTSSTSSAAAESNPPRYLSGAPALEKLRDLLGHFRSAMLITRVDGRTECRPMGLTQSGDEFDGTLWFFTDESSLKVQEIAKGAEVVLILQSDDDHAYVQLDGKASLSRDRERMKALYTPLIKTWFPKGLDDPRLALIRFDVQGGRYWDSPGGMLSVLAAFTRSVLTGQSGGGGENGEVKIN